MAMALRALMLDNALEFVFGEVPSTLRGLNDLTFSSHYLSTSYQWMDWSATWPRRNFPGLFNTLTRLLPKSAHKLLLPGDYVFSEFIEVSADHQCELSSLVS